MAENTGGETVMPYFLSGLMGLAGVVLLAMGSHPPAQGVVAIGGQFLLFHAAAVMAVSNQRAFGGIYKRAAQALLLAGPIIFAAETVLSGMAGMRVPLMAPLGGGMAILGWLCVAIGAIRVAR